MKRLTKGFVHLYTGTGKGKTTAAIGLAARALGAGYRVCVIQFLKGCTVYHEGIVLRRFKQRFKLVRFKQVHPMFCAKKRSKAAVQDLKRQLVKDFAVARDIVFGNRYDVVILDEVVNIVDQRFLPEKELIALIRSKPKRLELVLTGRGGSNRLKRLAGYVTEMRLLKHPYYKGTRARAGIEY